MSFNITYDTVWEKSRIISWFHDVATRVVEWGVIQNNDLCSSIASIVKVQISVFLASGFITEKIWPCVSPFFHAKFECVHTKKWIFNPSY